jgi:4-hydroxy-4-methyl-2-oxoglutarate aldolase
MSMKKTAARAAGSTRGKAKAAPAKSLVQRLARLTVAGIADQFDRRALVPPVLSRSLQPVGPEVRFAGPAFCVAGHRLNVEGWRALPTGRDALYDSLDEKVPAGAVLVFSTSGYDDSAVFGGGTGLAMKRRGAVGVIVDGAVRDVEELVACRLPVLAQAVSAIRFVGRFALTNVGTPVEVRGLTGPLRVASGDLVLSDRDGVIVVPAALAEEIIAAAEAAAAVDAKVKAEVLRGTPRLEATRKFRKE